MNIHLRKRLRAIVELERHRLGPRIHVFGRRIHEYQCGFAVLAFAPLAWFQGRPGLALASGAGLWLVVKDWPDLFPATRDKASWRLGVHRLPRRSAVERDRDRTGDLWLAKPLPPFTASHLSWGALALRYDLGERSCRRIVVAFRAKNAESLREVDPEGEVWSHLQAFEAQIERMRDIRAAARAQNNLNAVLGAERHMG